MPKFNEQNCHPFQFETMRHHQSLDNNVLNRPFVNPHEFLFQMFGSHKLVCLTTGGQCCIVLADAMLPCLVTWHHQLAAHEEGMVWLETSIRCHFWHGNPRGEIWNQLRACDVCARMKKNSPKEGQLAPCDIPSVPSLEARVNLIGPWELKSQGASAKFQAMTIIDPVTDLVETVPREHALSRMKQAWVGPFPMLHVHRNGTVTIQH